MTMMLIDANEIHQYIDARYVSTPEACWRILNIKMHDHSHQFNACRFIWQISNKLHWTQMVIWRMQWTMTHAMVWAQLHRAGAWYNVLGFCITFCLEQHHQPIDGVKARDVRRPSLLCESENWGAILPADIADNPKESNILQGYAIIRCCAARDVQGGMCCP